MSEQFLNDVWTEFVCLFVYDVIHCFWALDSLLMMKVKTENTFLM